MRRAKGTFHYLSISLIIMFVVLGVVITVVDNKPEDGMVFFILAIIFLINYFFIVVAIIIRRKKSHEKLVKRNIENKTLSGDFQDYMETSRYENGELEVFNSLLDGEIRLEIITKEEITPKEAFIYYKDGDKVFFELAVQKNKGFHLENTSALCWYYPKMKKLNKKEKIELYRRVDLYNLKAVNKIHLNE